jgi:GT2 family glycosyltransferase
MNLNEDVQSDSWGMNAKNIQVEFVHLNNGFQKRLLDTCRFNFSRVQRRYFQRRNKFQTTLPTSKNYSDFKDIEIVIPLYGPSELLERCLGSIKDSRGIRAKVVLVDNGTSADLGDLLKRFSCVAEVVKNSENLGFGKACDQGIKITSGEIVVLLNSDIVLRADSLRILIDEIEDKPAVALCSSVLINDFGRIEEAGRALSNEAVAVALYDNVKESELPNCGISTVPYASFACVALRTEAYKLTSGFDLAFAPAYSEDVDLSIQLHDLGFASIVSFHSRVFHIQGLSSSHLPELGEIKERNRKYLYGKHVQYFKSISLLDDPRRFPHQLKRAVGSNMKSRKLIFSSKSLSIDELCLNLEIDRSEILFNYIGVVLIDSETGAVRNPDREFAGIFQEYGLDLYGLGDESIHKWFQNRICLFDEIICLPSDMELISQDLFKFVKYTQPQAVFRVFES